MQKTSTNIKQAKAKLSELVSRAESGETVTITRRGRTVAQITATPPSRKPIDLCLLSEFRSRLPETRQGSQSLIQELRDQERY